MNRAECVVEIVHPPDGLWVTVKLSSGRIDQGTVLVCSETHGRYRVENFAIGGGWQAMAAGYRTILLTGVDTSNPNAPIAPGMHLASEET